MPQAFDPKLCTQLSPAAMIPALLSLGMQYKSFSIPFPFSPQSLSLKTNNHSCFLAALQVDIKWQNQKWLTALSLEETTRN